MAFTAENHYAPDLIIDETTIASKIVDPGDNPASVIHEGDVPKVKINWKQDGNKPFLDAWETAEFFYQAKVYLERMGPGTDPDVAVSAKKKLQAPAVAGDIVGYSRKIDLEASPGTPLAAGVYKLVITLSLYNKVGDWSPWHSYEERGMIEVVSTI